MSDEPKKPEWQPLEGVPIFELEARDRPGPFEQRLNAVATLDTLRRFAYGNCRFNERDLKQIGAFVLANLPSFSAQAVWAVAAEIYLLGMMDGVAMHMAQAELDAQKVRSGRVM